MDSFADRIDEIRRSRSTRNLSIPFMLFLRSKTGLASLIILLFYVILALFAPHIAPYNPLQVDLAKRLLPPSFSHIMGTDDFGRDIFSRVVYAIRLDLEIALISVSIAYIIGVLAGTFAGYTGKIMDNGIMRVMDIFLAFPVLIFAIAIAVTLGTGFLSIIIAISVTSIPGFSRVARSTVLSTKNELYVTAAVSQGASKAHILFKHILPSAFAPTIVLYALGLGNAISLAAALSFLGVGIHPPTPELGAMIVEGLQYVVSGQWWMSVLPGLFIVLIVIAFNMMGDTIREVTDVSLRR
ncbi:MAG: ABC transporter permease [Thermoplasmatales archaeon]|jgi:peptide/nickel transport system permease protein|nr:ABC transporter permease [Candidatus Thermoplasmatota archaeon]MDA8054591.1 ABC transporter permease [Thermoplasmatales archaeon]